MNSPEAARIWRNGLIPVIYDRGKRETLLVRTPYRADNSIYLLGRRGRDIYWDDRHKAWELPRSRFSDVVRLSLDRWRAVYIIQAYRELRKCAPACWEAKGYDCECSCLGENHGSGVALPHVVSDTFAFEWGPKRLACRLLKTKEPECPNPSNPNSSPAASAA